MLPGGAFKQSRITAKTSPESENIFWCALSKETFLLIPKGIVVACVCPSICRAFSHD